MKVKLTINLTDEEYEAVESISDLENYVIQVLKEEIEVPNYSHTVVWDLDTYNRTIETKWEEELQKDVK